MDRKQKIASLFKILPLYESVVNTEDKITADDYLSYLDRISVEYLGMGENDIYNSLRGLRELGTTLEVKTVRSVVFHMTNML